jgi:hypothetical protein
MGGAVLAGCPAPAARRCSLKPEGGRVSNRDQVRWVLVWMTEEG